MTAPFLRNLQLQNEDTLAFLYRAPKVNLKPLSIPLIANKYREIFSLSEDAALSMAKATMGYSFAFQALGYLCWSRKKSWQELLPEYDTYLQDYVYDKIWSELSKKDKEILGALSSAPAMKVQEILERLNMRSNAFTVYRARLLRKGILISPEYGSLAFSLPRFREFVQRSGTDGIY